MTIQPVHHDTALTLEQWRALDPTGNRTGPAVRTQGFRP